MALCKPGGTIEIAFDDLVFIVRELSFGEVCELEERLDALNPKASREFAKELEKIIGPLICGWKNGPCEYSWDAWVQNAQRQAFLQLPWKIVAQIGTSEKKV